MIAGGGAGACVSLIGVRRAFEEAGIEPELIISCSGGTIWGSMWAAGMSAQEMADFSLSGTSRTTSTSSGRRSRDTRLGAQGLHRPRQGRSDRAHLRRALRAADGGRARIPICRSSTTSTAAGSTTSAPTRRRSSRSADWYGSRSRCRPYRGGRGRRTPLRRRRDHRPVSGRADPERRRLRPRLRDQLHAAAAARARRHHRLERHADGSAHASRQAEQGFQLELARRHSARSATSDHHRRRRPQPAARAGFYDLFIDRSRWPELISAGYERTAGALDALRPTQRPPRPALPR